MDIFITICLSFMMSSFIAYQRHATLPSRLLSCSKCIKVQFLSFVLAFFDKQMPLKSSSNTSLVGGCKLYQIEPRRFLLIIRFNLVMMKYFDSKSGSFFSMYPNQDVQLPSLSAAVRQKVMLLLSRNSPKAASIAYLRLLCEMATKSPPALPTKSQSLSIPQLQVKWQRWTL